MELGVIMNPHVQVTGSIEILTLVLIRPFNNVVAIKKRLKFL